MPGSRLGEGLAQFEGRAPIPEAIAMQGGRAGFGVFYGHSDVEKGVGIGFRTGQRQFPAGVLAHGHGGR